jgi:diguanylate cyclase (GGDEF)-like protein
MLQYSVEELQEGKDRDELAAPETSSENSFVRVLAGEHIPIFERMFRKKDGSVFPVEINLELVRDEDGTPLHVQSIVRDITERKQAEDALQKANEQLRVDMEKIEQLKEELREQAIHDPLTNLYNRRYLNETLPRELARVERDNNSLSVVISDIDHFKMINDTYGHPVGDKFLVNIASLMKKNARGSDIVCRYGGEEFLLVMPNTSLDAAAKRAEEIRQKCAEVIIQHEGKDLRITMSFGVATHPNHGKEAEEIIIKADAALYRAKAQGRNCTVVFE